MNFCCFYNENKSNGINPHKIKLFSLITVFFLKNILKYSFYIFSKIELFFFLFKVFKKINYRNYKYYNEKFYLIKNKRLIKYYAYILIVF